MGQNAYVYSVQDTSLKEKIDRIYEEEPWLEEDDSIFGLRSTELIKDGRTYAGEVLLGRNIRLPRDNAPPLQLDYLLAIMVNTPVMAWADGWRSPDQRLEFESALQDIGINKENLLYQGIFYGDGNRLIPEKYLHQ